MLGVIFCWFKITNCKFQKKFHFFIKNVHKNTRKSDCAPKFQFILTMEVEPTNFEAEQERQKHRWVVWCVVSGVHDSIVLMSYEHNYECSFHPSIAGPMHHSLFCRTLIQYSCCCRCNSAYLVVMLFELGWCFMSMLIRLSSSRMVLLE